VSKKKTLLNCRRTFILGSRSFDFQLIRVECSKLAQVIYDIYLSLKFILNIITIYCENTLEYTL
jgi:hypothetical protein